MADFFEAVSKGDVKAVRRHLEEGKIDVNIKDMSGDTALHIAATKGWRQIVTLLVSKGADVNMQNNVGSTPLHKAAVGNQIFVVKHLLEHGADPSVRNASGMLAEDLTDYGTIKEMLQGDASVKEAMHVPKEFHRKIIGAKGAKLKEIREKTGAVIILPKPEEQSSSITLQGRAEQVAVAKEMIAKLVSSVIVEDDSSLALLRPEKLPQVAEKENMTTVHVPIPKEKHKYIIGKGGRTVTQLSEQFGVQVIIPSLNSAEANITIRGDQNGVDAAIKRMFELTKDKATEKPQEQSISQIRKALLASNAADKVEEEQAERSPKQKSLRRRPKAPRKGQSQETTDKTPPAVTEASFPPLPAPTPSPASSLSAPSPETPHAQSKLNGKGGGPSNGEEAAAAKTEQPTKPLERQKPKGDAPVYTPQPAVAKKPKRPAQASSANRGGPGKPQES